jgi:hypothetical protein
VSSLVLLSQAYKRRGRPSRGSPRPPNRKVRQRPAQVRRAARPAPSREEQEDGAHDPITKIIRPWPWVASGAPATLTRPPAPSGALTPAPPPGAREPTISHEARGDASSVLVPLDREDARPTQALAMHSPALRPRGSSHSATQDRQR